MNWMKAKCGIVYADGQPVSIWGMEAPKEISDKFANNRESTAHNGTWADWIRERFMRVV